MYSYYIVCDLTSRRLVFISCVCHMLCSEGVGWYDTYPFRHTFCLCILMWQQWICAGDDDDGGGLCLFEKSVEECQLKDNSCGFGCIAYSWFQSYWLLSLWQEESILALHAVIIAFRAWCDLHSVLTNRWLSTALSQNTEALAQERNSYSWL